MLAPHVRRKREGVPMRVHDYRDLIVWQKSVDLTHHVYELVRRFPAEERYALSSQMRRAAISVASNIAEGNAFFHRAQYIRYLGLARGSLFELGTQIEIAARLTFIEPTDASTILVEIDSISRMLQRLSQRLRESRTPERTDSRALPASRRRALTAASPRPPPAVASLTSLDISSGFLRTRRCGDRARTANCASCIRCAWDRTRQ